jgi:hypothetical protein
MFGYTLSEELEDALVEAKVSHEAEKWAMEDSALQMMLA